VTLLLPIAKNWLQSSTALQAVPATLTSDISLVSRYCGQLSPFVDNTDNYFTVQDVGLPDGCQVEQARSLHRHGNNRFSTAFFNDGDNDLRLQRETSNLTD
jgi:hypothetical protein